jgi:hypothetical protein
MAAKDAFDTEPSAAEGTMNFHGLQEIMRAGWLIAAAGVRTEGHLEHRTEESLVKANQDANDMRDGPGDHGS